MTEHRPLRHTGRGGDILNVDVAFGASSTAQGLFISGAGGAASAFVVNPRDNSPNQPQNSFGGEVGRGGDGGNISGVTQRGNIDIHVDLISGNGGDTINYGTVIDPAPNVGRGGSISNVIIAGNIGNIDPTVAIQSYNNFLGGETVAKYVDRKFRDPLAPAGPSLSDADGNVGIIVGAAGRNKAVVLDPQGHPHTYVTQPSTGARNGDLINLTTRNLMSAVAGSVDRIAAIQTCMNIQILNGQVGSDKGIINVAEYLDADGNPTVNGRPVRDGRLLDGALICKALLDGGGNNVTLPGRVFFL